MKLQFVPARTGFTWVQLGVKTFIRQPLALAGLFFMFMAVVSVLSIVPLVGSAVSLALVPAATLGLMAATREATDGRFPMPVTLVTAFRSGQARTQSVLVLGGMYAFALLLVLGVASLFSGPTPLPVDMANNEMTPEMVQSAVFSTSLWVGLALYVPVVMAFWHAPALVHWHGVSPGKSLFFSLAACWANRGAMLLYGLGWLGVFLLGGLLISLLGALLGGAQTMGFLLYPAVLLMASMFHTSIYFSYRDSFSDDGAKPQPNTS
jgi:hypothetical protein